MLTELFDVDRSDDGIHFWNLTFLGRRSGLNFRMNSVNTEGLSMEFMFPPDKYFKQRRGKIQRLKSKK